MRWISAFVLLTLCTHVDGQTLEYRWQPGQKFSYEMEVIVDTDQEKITYKGMTHYTVTSSNAAQSTLTYRGGLRESKQSKQRQTRGFPFGGPFGPRGIGGPPSPFSRPAFAGKTQTTNKLTLSTRGSVLAMEGDSQLPYLIGNVSLLPFEPLPAANERTWKYDTGISITEKDEDQRPFGPFGPRGRFGPFGQDDSENVQAAGEGGTFRIQKTNGNLVEVAKTYYLNTPRTEDNNLFKMQGQGTWTFDAKDKVPHAYDMKISLSISSGNSTTNIPITIKYTRISPERLAAMEAESKRKAEEAARVAAEKKSMAETPLTSAEKSQVLAALASTNTASQIETLNRMAEKSLANPDPEIAAAIESLLTSGDAKVAGAADKALRKWSPEYAKRKKLAKDYQGPSPVGSTGLVVESITPLYVGQIVQAQRPRRGSFWRPARVKELLPDGQVKLAFLTWGKENDRDIVPVPRRQIQLAPPELEQPAAPTTTATPAMAKNTAQLRTWSDVTGRFKIEASFVDLVDGKVRLKRADGKMIAPLPLEKLSEADQAFVKQQQTAANPFQLE